MPAADKKSYHHGDLRGALIAAAESLIAKRASSSFTLREVARAAGVSHNAPYNHFADRRSLLAAVAERGFDDLALALERSLEATDAADLGASIRATARAYVTFAVAHPSAYRLMFSAELAGCEDEALTASGERAFAILRNLIAEGAASGRLRPDPHVTHALTAWSLVHGLATLILDGKVPLLPDDPTAAALADTVAATLVGGLAIPG